MTRTELLESTFFYRANGTTTRVYIYQDYDDAPDHDTGPSSIPGNKHCRLGNGTSLKRVDDNTFKNIATGELLFRIKPKK